MPDARLIEFRRQTIKELLATMTPKERLKDLSAVELMKALPPARLDGSDPL